LHPGILKPVFFISGKDLQINENGFINHVIVFLSVVSLLLAAKNSFSKVIPA
jgi:hypothetical protein